MEFKVTQQTYNSPWFELGVYGCRPVLSEAPGDLAGGEALAHCLYFDGGHDCLLPFC